MKQSRYTVILRGEHRFTLSRYQITHDSPNSNFLAGCFLSEYQESASKTVELDHDPALFTLIVQHLSGYKILPLAPSAVPPTMTSETAMENLAKDAAFLGLDDLYRLLTTPALTSGLKGWSDWNGPIVTFEDVVSGKLPKGVRYTDKGLVSMREGEKTVREVLVYAKNRFLSVVWEQDEFEDDHEDNKQKFALKYKLEITPEENRLLQQRHQAWVDEARKPDFCGLSAVTCEEGDGGFSINGRHALIGNMDLFCSVLDQPRASRRDHPRYEEFRVFDELFPEALCAEESNMEEPGSSLWLWTDQVLFTIGLYPIYGAAPQEARTSIILVLHEISARTRGAIQRACFPLLPPDSIHLTF